MADNRQDIDDVRAELQESKKDLALAQNAGDLLQVDFHRKRLLQLESQLSSLREQQILLLRSSQQVSPVQLLTSTAALNDRQVHQPPVLDAEEQASDRVVGSLQSHGYGWLKLSEAETHSFHQLQQYTSPGRCLHQAGMLLKDKRLLQYNAGSSSFSLPSAMRTAANKVSAADNKQSRLVKSCHQSSDKLVTAAGMRFDGLSC